MRGMIIEKTIEMDRNGYKQRSLLTTDGKILLDKPQFRETSFYTAVFDNYSRVERAVESIILESYLSGVSTRSVNKVVQSLDVQVSPSYVSSLSSRLDKTVNEFLERKIDGEYKFIYIDGTYLKIRNNGRYRNKRPYTFVQELTLKVPGRYQDQEYMILKLKYNGNYSSKI